MQTEKNDNELMGAYVQGDEDAFRQLFVRYSTKLIAYLRYRLGKRKDYLADEIFQKTWLKIHVGRKSFQPQYKFSSWLYTIALNTLRDEVGSASERLRSDELDDETPSNETSVEEQYVSKEKFKELQFALTQLKENQRVALLLSDEDDLSSKEIAGVMGISEVSARQLISRARREIRKHFIEKGEA